jgi:hypothetical protein
MLKMPILWSFASEVTVEAGVGWMSGQASEREKLENDEGRRSPCRFLEGENDDVGRPGLLD